MSVKNALRPESFFKLFGSITALPGIGIKLKENFTKLGVTVPRDLLFFAPVNIIDRSLTESVCLEKISELVTVTITVVSYILPTGRGPLRVLVTDSKSEIELVFFHPRLSWIKKLLPVGEMRVVSGRLENVGNSFQVIHPDFIVSCDEFELMGKIEPVYPLTKGLTQKVLRNAIKTTLEMSPNLDEWINESLILKKKWPNFSQAIFSLHNPKNINDLCYHNLSRERLAYDELFAHQVALSIARNRFQRVLGISSRGTGVLTKKLINNLPFSLTMDQLSVIEEISADMSSKNRMNRLLQGDVGSGKTVVALIAMMKAIESGGQVAIMAPTEILANQHFDSIASLTTNVEVELILLTGRDKGKQKKDKLKAIFNGSAQLIIGTHALFQENVRYKNLTFVVVDEQHKFGVIQRMSLGNKGKNCDILVMTATPIPRSLTLACYGDMDLSIIQSKPKGRKVVDTVIIPSSKIKKILDRLKVVLGQGRQAYWVCPLIEDSENLQVTAAETRFQNLKLELPEVSIGLVHGQLPASEKDCVMDAFIRGELKLLVSTTVIEVGVDVPAASIMIIESSERFGLAQLHQLRGRVGRGSVKSDCILIYGSQLSENSRTRLEILRKTDDGFLIAEEDLKIRGAGDLLGSQQSGLPVFQIADLLKHQALLSIARDDSRMILSNDPELKSVRGEAIRKLLFLMKYDKSIKLLNVG